MYDEDEEEFTDDGSAELIDEDSPLKDLDELGRRVAELRRLRALRDSTKKAAEDAKKEFDIYQAELIDDYRRSPLKGSVTVEIEDDLEVQITPVRTHYARIIDRDAAEAHFRKMAQSKEYVKEDFRMGRLHELIRACIEQKKPLPEGLDFYTKEYFRITEKD